MKREMEYTKAGWIKYSNRLFPKWEKEHWTVWVTARQGTAFHNYENAIIFKKLVEVQEQIQQDATKRIKGE